MRNNVTIIVKPTNECNFRCQYCYHADTEYDVGIMSDICLELLIKKVQSEFRQVVYVWHGGEPLLCGLDFFEKAVSYQKKYAKPTSIYINSIQTNGLLLDQDYLEFFLKHNFSVCVSYDGPGECNCLRESTSEIERHILASINSGVNTSVLSVISNRNIGCLIEMYKYYRDNNIHAKFNPIFESTALDCREYLIDSEEYANALISFFDYWVNDTNAIEIEPLCQYVRMALGFDGRECIYESCLAKWLGIDHNGNLYPCGRSYPQEYLLGNISDYESIPNVFENEVYLSLLKSAILRRSDCQEKCKYYGVCHGGCNNNCIIEGVSKASDTFMCKVFCKVYPYVSSWVELHMEKGNIDTVSNHIIQSMIKTRLHSAKR